MNQSIIDKYKIKFYNKVMDFDNGKRIQKIPDTNHVISLFLFDWTADNINDYLMPKINDVINGILNEYETGAQTMAVIVEPQNTTFYLEGMNSNYPSMPTADFKEIIQSWKDFLTNAPLNGTAVK